MLNYQRVNSRLISALAFGKLMMKENVVHGLRLGKFLG